MQSDSPPVSPRRRCIPLIASLLIPGTGQLLLSQYVAGSICLAVYLLIWAGCILLRLPTNYGGYLLLICGMLLIVCIAALHTAYCRDERFPRLSIWWSVPIIFVGFVSMFLHLNAPTRLAGFRPFTIPSTSMEPAIRKGDAIMVDLKYYKQKPPKDGDLVI